MSLGAFWSLLNPLVLMVVYTFVFTKFFDVPSIPHFSLYLLCGIIPFNFFALSWVYGTNSLLENAGLIKRVPVPREIVPIASVLSNCVHLVIQVGLLLALVLLSGLGVNIQWFWLPLIWAIEIVFIFGISLITAGLNVYMRDTRYVVESINVMLFWFVPIFYSVSKIPAQYRGFYLLNPVSALIVALRAVLLDGQPPPATVLLEFIMVSFGTLVVGWALFRQMKARFYDYL